MTASKNGAVTKYLNIVIENRTFIFFVNKHFSDFITLFPVAKMFVTSGRIPNEQKLPTFKVMILEKLMCRMGKY